MAGRGPAPKPAATRRRRNAVQTTQICLDGQIHGPDLPADTDWHPQTLIWWENWRRSDQASSLQPIEWDFLLDTARLHSEFWSGTSSVAGELRLRVAKFGATMEDRLRLHLEAVQPDASQPSAAKKTRDPAAERRKAALRLVTGDEEAG